ncbi:MAG: RNase adapter RapZ [Duodenibacillus sp.]|nr:RNase adapter RapZ [Duodenibacillus sp.]
MTPSCDYTLETVRIIIVTGLSGSGKSIAVRQLEDSGYYCVDNLPIGFLVSVVQSLAEHGHTRIAVSVDARSQVNISDAGNAIEALKTRGCDVRMLFLTASTPELVQRFSETRRRHPLTLPRPDGTANMTLAEAIALERDKLAPAAELGHVIDTTGLAANTLRNWVRQFSEAEQSMMTLAFESFAFKHGLPVVADLVFDVRNLPNPYYDKALRPLTGLDAPIIKYLDNLPIVQDMVDDIARFIERWLPSYEAQNRHYLTVAIGCTGGQHRSVYVAQALAKRFAGKTVTVLRHRQLSRMGLGVSTEQTL